MGQEYHTISTVMNHVEKVYFGNVDAKQGSWNVDVVNDVLITISCMRMSYTKAIGVVQLHPARRGRACIVPHII